jgi:hypothetical protein
MKAIRSEKGAKGVDHDSEDSVHHVRNSDEGAPSEVPDQLG